MSRKVDVEKILMTAKEQYESICKAYDKALRDESLDIRVPVKNLMENLRSTLDYMAHDIYERCCQTARMAAGKPNPRNIYFPYGHTEADFKSGVGSSLPGLVTLAPRVYDLIASIQPFQCGDNWLYDFCLILNENKHDKLTPQVRTKRETYSVKSEFGSVTIQINSPKASITSLPGAVKISDVPAQLTNDGIRTAPSDRIKHERTKWVAFLFDGYGVNVLGLLERAVPGVTNLAKALYNEI